MHYSVLSIYMHKLCQLHQTKYQVNTLQKLIYSRCRIMFILCFMPKRSICVSNCLAIKNVLRMQGGHKPFSYVTISFSPLYYLIYSQFCLVQPIQIYFHIWLKISVKIKILLVRNALLSLVNLYTQVTKKQLIFYRYKSIGLVLTFK